MLYGGSRSGKTFLLRLGIAGFILRRHVTEAAGVNRACGVALPLFRVIYYSGTRILLGQMRFGLLIL
jgi:hypothetical protein